MTGASFILAINLFIATLFALAFSLVAVSNRSDRVAFWFALAYVFGAFYVVFEFILPNQEFPRLAYTAGFAAFLGATASVGIGIARRYGRPVPWLSVSLISVISILANWFGFGLEHDSIPRNLIYQAPYAAMQLLAAWFVLRSGRRQPIELGLLVLFVLSAAQFLSKPFAALLLGGSGSTSASYIATTYALYSQSLGAMLQVTMGLLMLMVLVRDMLVEITTRSETDPLSGVLNRRGFDERSTPMLQQSMQAGPAASLVLADLDGFKLINDNFGHDTGDDVIVRFAALLRDTAPQRAVVGRIGGEEFAVFLPGANLAAARLFAEAARSAFASLPIGSLPLHFRCTASFGVAEAVAGQSLGDLRRRADTALYAAKRAGRDRVQLAADADLDEMPLHPANGTSLARTG